MPYSSFKPKPFRQQVIVVLGATTPLGRKLIMKLIHEGSRVVMSSGNAEELQSVLDSAEKKTERILAVVADTTTFAGAEEVMEAALAVYRRVDTWINVEGEMVEDECLGTDFARERKRFDLIFWSMRYGCEVAWQGMKEKGGLIINLGLDQVAQTQPLLGMFKAGKLATKGFTAAFRAQVRDRKLPVLVSFILPTQNLDETVETIMKCIQKPKMEMVAGGAVRMTALIETFFPRVNELLMENHMRERKNNKRMFYVKEQ